MSIELEYELDIIGELAHQDWEAINEFHFTPLWTDPNEIHVTEICWCLNKALLSRVLKNGNVPIIGLALLRGKAFHKLYESKPEKLNRLGMLSEFRVEVPTQYGTRLVGTADIARPYLMKDGKLQDVEDAKYFLQSDFNWYIADIKTSLFLTASSIRKYSMQLNSYKFLLPLAIRTNSTISPRDVKKISHLFIFGIDSSPFRNRQFVNLKTIPIEPSLDTWKDFLERFAYFSTAYMTFQTTGEYEQINDPYAEAFECDSCPHAEICEFTKKKEEKAK